MSTRPLRLSSARLAAVFVLILASGVTVLLATVYVLTARVLDQEVDSVIRAEVSGLVDDYERGGLLQLISAVRRRQDGWGRTGAVYMLIEPNGFPLAGNLVRWPDVVREYDGFVEFEIDASDAGGVVAHPVRAQIFDLPGDRRLLVGTDVLERKRLAGRLRTAMIWGVGLCVLLATFVGVSYSRRVRRRVSSIAATCETIIAGDLSQRLGVERSQDEFDELATAVNHMLDRIQQQTETLRTTFDSAAHDLRAPLYRARVRIEESLQHEGLDGEVRETMEATLAELERVQRTLTTLLQIAQADSRGRDEAKESVDVAALARELVELYQPEANAHAITLTCQADSPAHVRGNRQLLAQVLVNLLENALKYVPEQGVISVRVAERESEVSMIVADNGPGIPAADRQRILQPFVRLERDRSQPGSGLGLSLVNAVVKLHGGRVELEDNAPGLRVQCVMPASQE